MKALIIISHPETESFCYDGIYRTIKSTLSENENVEIKTAELYQENFGRDNKELIEKYKEYVSWSTHIYFVSPVWWFRCTPKLEVFFDEIFTQHLHTILFLLPKRLDFHHHFSKTKS